MPAEKLGVGSSERLPSAAVPSLSDAGLHGSACSQPSHNQEYQAARVRIGFALKGEETVMQETLLLFFRIGRLRGMQEKKFSHSRVAPCTLNRKCNCQ